MFDIVKRYAKITPIVQQALVDKGVPSPAWGTTDVKEVSRFTGDILRVMVGLGMTEDVETQAAHVASQLLSVGILEPLLLEDGVEEIIVRNGIVMVEQYGKIYNLGTIALDKYFHDLAKRVAEERRRSLRAAMPFAFADLPDGSRFTGMISPLSVNGTAINIRVFSRQRWTLEHLTEKGIFRHQNVTADISRQLIEIARDKTPQDFLAEVVARGGWNILVSGKPGSGKTTLVSALTHYLPTTAQLCIAETFRELKPGLHTAAWAVARQDTDEESADLDAVVNILYTRMRPDMIIVGEIVGHEAEEFIEAMSIGVGAMATIHGHSPADALYRLERRALGGRMTHAGVRDAVANGVNLVIQLARRGEHRFVSDIAVVKGLGESGHYDVQSLREVLRWTS